MAGVAVPRELIDEAVALYRTHKSTVKVGAIMGVNGATIGRWLAKVGEPRLGHTSVHGIDKRKKAAAAPKRASGSLKKNKYGPSSKLTVPASPTRIRRYLLTAAQDETPVHQPFWANLRAYADYLGAEILVGGYTYQKGLFEDHAIRAGVFASDIAPLLRQEVLDLGPRIQWYGKANILPTAVDPLSGWETATKERCAVIPHAKIALKCIPVMHGAQPKQIMTTGVVTMPNYVQRNAGVKAEFHHSIGATIVEVAQDGVHFCRQLSASSKDGAFEDLDILVHDGQIFKGQRVEAITFGDIHREKIDPEVALGSFGFYADTGKCDFEGSMLSVLKPAYSFIHDSFDFTARSHHTRNDPHERVKRIAENLDSVQDAVRATSQFLAAIRRPYTKIVHVASNHNIHLHRWLKDASAFADPVNSAYWCELNAATLRAFQGGNELFNIHEHALRRETPDGLAEVVFLREGESFLICQGQSPVECGLHGDVGPRGARGSAAAFARTVERMNVAHTHEPAIREAVYYAGTTGKLDFGYNTKGQGAWQHAHIVTYSTGKRSIITLNGRRWRA